MYTTPAGVRLRLGLSEIDASDIHLNKFIIDAQELLLDDLAGYRIDEVLGGTVDGTNKYFYTEKRFIADQNFDKIIDGNDLTVYLWTDSGDPTTKSITPVSSVDGDIGQITLTTAPPSTTTQITCDYRFYNSRISWVSVNMATSYLAGYLWVLRDRLLLPDSVRMGSVMWRISWPQWRELYTEYLRIVARLKGKMVVHGELPIPEELGSRLPSETGFSRSASEDEVK